MNKTRVDSIFINAKVYTADKDFRITECFAVDKGKFVATGSYEEVVEKFSGDTVIDIGGKFVYPGFIDAHCHFTGYSKNLDIIMLNNTNSFDEVIPAIVNSANSKGDGWILGRGWDQNKWDNKAFPDKTHLDSLFPNRPVALTRTDGHAALVNSYVLKLAGITVSTKVDGGEIVIKNGEPSGILVDNAMNLYTHLIPEPTGEELLRLLNKAESDCFREGLTSVTDAGLNLKTIMELKGFYSEGKMNIRINSMLESEPEEIEFVKHGMKITTDYLNVSSIKIYADGALGSRGACLLEPYSDRAGHYGFLCIKPDSLREICRIAYNNNYQVCVHAIGDSANRFVLNIFSEFLKEKNNRRWRIEHCQVVSPGDFNLFGKYSVIPSVQPYHAVSDMQWAGERLGPAIVKNAYAYKQLLEQNGWLAYGSDFPVEDISPLAGFYAAVARKDKNGLPAGGFQTENAISREQSLKAMTIWAAMAGFEENVKGSIEAGKFADFVILDRDIITENENLLPETVVIGTYINGKKVYETSTY